MNKHFMNKKTIKAVSLLLTMLMIACNFVGCSTSGNGSGNTDNGSINLPTDQTLQLPLNGGTLRMPMPVNAAITNPFAVDTEEMLNMFSLVYEGLIRVDETNNIIPSLAENWSCDASGRVWILNLRQDAKWHSKDDSVEADDIKYSYDTIVSMQGASYYSYNVSKIESMEIVNDYCVRVTMKEKGVLSLRCLDFPIVRNGAGLGGKPVGTGAYQVETYSNDKVVLAANENWWKQRPYIDRVEFEARDSNETALASFAAGQFNMVPTSAITAGRYRQEGVSEVLDVMTQDMEVLIVNHDNYILRDVRIRQAVAYMIDRSEIISNVCMNRAQACDVPIAPDSWFYDSKSKVYDHSLNKAMSLLEEAGYTDADENGVLEKNGIELELNILVCESADGTRGEAAREIAKQLTDAGIKAQVVIAAYSMTDGGEFMSKLKNGEFDLALVGFNMSRDCDLSPYLDETGECNYGGYHGSELAELAHAMYTASDEASLRESASAFQSKFVSQLPFIVLYFRLNSIVCSADIRDIGAVREPDIMRNAEKWYIAESEQNGAE